MRLHPAVATALVLVGGVLLALPAWELVQLAARPVSTGIPATLLMASLLSGALGMTFIVVAVLFSFEIRSRSNVSS